MRAYMPAELVHVLLSRQMGVPFLAGGLVDQPAIVVSDHILVLEAEGAIQEREALKARLDSGRGSKSPNPANRLRSRL